MTILTLQDGELKTTLKKHVYDIVGCCQAVHREKGPALTELVYQDCLEIALSQSHIPFQREFSFYPSFRGVQLRHRLQVDFLCMDDVFVECKAIEQLSEYERLQLTNYMRNANIKIGILYNFYPVFDQCEKFYYDKGSDTLYYF